MKATTAYHNHYRHHHHSHDHNHHQILWKTIEGKNNKAVTKTSLSKCFRYFVHRVLIKSWSVFLLLVFFSPQLSGIRSSFFFFLYLFGAAQFKDFFSNQHFNVLCMMAIKQAKQTTHYERLFMTMPFSISH